MHAKTSFSKILFSYAHTDSPFKYQQEFDKGLIATRKVGTKTKVAAIAAAIILAIPTLGIGSIISFYVITAISKYRTQKNGDTVVKVIRVSTREFKPRPLEDNQTTFNDIPAAWTADLRVPPANGVSVRINNLGNTCWLNSFLKLLATDDLFDAALTCTDADIQNIVLADYLVAEEDQAVEIENRIRLRDHLKFIVHTLRDETPLDRKYIDPKYVASLVEILHSFNAELGYTQCDAVEVLDLVVALFDFPARVNDQQIPALTTAYHNPLLQRPSSTLSSAVVTVSAANPAVYDQHHIDFNKCLNDPQVENYNLESDTGVRGDFEQRVRLTNAPDKLTIHVVRNDGRGKITAPIKMDDQLCVKIKSYVDAGNQFDERQEHTYEIVGAILHNGSSRSGHYTFIEKKGDTFLFHNDSKLNELTKEEALSLFSGASTFRLRKVSA